MPFTLFRTQRYTPCLLIIIALAHMLSGCATSAPPEKPSYKEAPKEAINHHE